jgi:hypothetical protein
MVLMRLSQPIIGLTVQDGSSVVLLDNQPLGTTDAQAPFTFVYTYRATTVGSVLFTASFPGDSHNEQSSSNTVSVLSTKATISSLSLSPSVVTATVGETTPVRVIMKGGYFVSPPQVTVLVPGRDPSLVTLGTTSSDGLTRSGIFYYTPDEAATAVQLTASYTDAYNN